MMSDTSFFAGARIGLILALGTAIVGTSGCGRPDGSSSTADANAATVGSDPDLVFEVAVEPAPDGAAAYVTRDGRYDDGIALRERLVRHANRKRGEFGLSLATLRIIAPSETPYRLVAPVLAAGAHNTTRIPRVELLPDGREPAQIYTWPTTLPGSRRSGAVEPVVTIESASDGAARLRFWDDPQTVPLSELGAALRSREPWWETTLRPSADLRFDQLVEAIGHYRRERDPDFELTLDLLIP